MKSLITIFILGLWAGINTFEDPVERMEEVIDFIGAGFQGEGVKIAGIRWS